MLVAPGPDLAEYNSQVILENLSSQASNSKANMGDNSVVPKKEHVVITWWQQFKYYRPSCVVNLTYRQKRAQRVNLRRAIPKLSMLHRKRRNNPGLRRDTIDFGCSGVSQSLTRPTTTRSVEQEKDVEKIGEE